MEAGDVRTVGVVGCGLMGSGIVEVVARSGIDAIYLEPTAELVEAGRGRVERSTAKAVERGKLEAEDRDAILGRVRGTVDAGDLAGVDLVIEAATEDPAVKIDTFRRLDEVTREEIVLASNTSSIPIATLGAATGRPERVIGMHFFNPPPVMSLLELTPSLSTSEETVAFARSFGERVGKTVVVAKDHAGFIVNRLVIPYLCAAIELYSDANGMAMPVSIAPFEVVVTPVKVADATLKEASEKLYAELQTKGLDVLYDDRDLSPGVKFKDADLIGVPWRITVGKKLAEGKVEITERRTGERSEIAVAESAAWIAERVAAAKQ